MRPPTSEQNTIGRYENSKFFIISFIEFAPIAIDTSQDKWTNVPDRRT